jgi:hypothetical protein
MANKLTAALDALRSLGRVASKIDAVDPADFARAVAEAAPIRKGAMQIKDMLTEYTPEEYALMRTFLTKDRGSGFAIKGGDELVSVFSGPRGRGDLLSREAVARGARRLDNFDIEGKLPELYGRAGFMETQRYPYDPAYAGELSDFVNRSQPDVVFMDLDPAVRQSLVGAYRPAAKDVERMVAGTFTRTAAEEAAARRALALMLGLPAGAAGVGLGVREATR